MSRSSLVAAAALLLLAGCGSNEVDRAVTGGGLGAVTGGLIAGPYGAVFGGVAGATVGVATGTDDINLGRPVWR
jgi:osmotically inducible lipoprotein OsmB